MPVAIILPDLGAGSDSLRIGCWHVEPGESVDVGESLAEILAPGILFDLPSPSPGVVGRIEKAEDAVVVPGDVLGWIEP